MKTITKREMENKMFFTQMMLILFAIVIMVIAMGVLSYFFQSFPPCIIFPSLIFAGYLINEIIKMDKKRYITKGKYVAIQYKDTYADFGTVEYINNSLDDFIIHEYTPGLRIETFEVKLPLVDGDRLVGKVSVEWEPNMAEFAEFIRREKEYPRVIQKRVSERLQQWAIKLTRLQAYQQNDGMMIDIPGIFIEPVYIADIQEGERLHLPLENRRLLDAIIPEFMDIIEVDQKEAELIKLFPQREREIRDIMEQKRSELIRRGMKRR